MLEFQDEIADPIVEADSVHGEIPRKSGGEVAVKNMSIKIIVKGISQAQRGTAQQTEST